MGGSPISGAVHRRGVTVLHDKAFEAQPGWLLLPQKQAVEIWRGDQQGLAERLENASRLEGDELADLGELFTTGVAVSAPPRSRLA